MQNPWINLPKNDPYILFEDQEAFETHGLSTQDFGLRLEVLPVPFIGSLNSAKIVLLGLNPGFSEDDLIKPQEDFEENQKALTFSSSIPFYCLNPLWQKNGGYVWWSKILKQLISIKGLSVVQKETMCIQYFPYHSKSFVRVPFTLPSQNFSFDLVREAIKKNLIIVVMRSKKLWFEAVPELISYPYIEVKNYRRPFLSRNNMRSEDFDKILTSK